MNFLPLLSIHRPLLRSIKELSKPEKLPWRMPSAKRWPNSPSSRLCLTSMLILGNQPGLGLSPMLLLVGPDVQGIPYSGCRRDDINLLECRQLLIPSFLQFSAAVFHTPRGYYNLLEPPPVVTPW